MTTDSHPRKGLFRINDKNYAFTFVLITSLFFLWGFAHSLLDVLNKHFQDALHLSKAQSGAVQASAYGAYFLMALPAGFIAKRFGYKAGILVGLTLFAIGAFWFVPAVQINAFWAFLLGLLVLFCGLTCLETVANPYTTVLGPEETSATRINLAQTFNALGWITGPLVGSLLIFKNDSGKSIFESFSETLEKIFLGAGSVVAEQTAQGAETAQAAAAHVSNSALIPPYVGLGCIVLLVLVLFFFSKLPEIHGEVTHAHGSDATHEALPKSKGTFALNIGGLYLPSHLLFGIVAQFLYVAAQTGIGSFFINYVVETKELGISELDAGILLGLGGMGCFAIGRFSGSMVMRAIKPGLLVGGFAAVNTLLMGVAAFMDGRSGIIALIASYLFMSIMFPSIMALGLKGLGQYTKTAASLLVMTVVGGAVCPALMGVLGDQFGMGIGFIVPLVCFAFIAFYGFIGSRQHID